MVRYSRTVNGVLLPTISALLETENKKPREKPVRKAWTVGLLASRSLARADD
jgi:hypothetical protein